jgi:hypothetical protein
MSDTIYYSDLSGKSVTKSEIEMEYKELIDHLRAKPSVDELVNTAERLKEGDKIIKV